VVLGQLVVVDAIDHGQVGAVRRRGDDDALGTGGQVRRSLVAGREDAGALHRDVDVEFLPRKLRRVALGQHLEAVFAGGDRVAVDGHFAGELAVHAVEAQQMRVGLDRAEVVDGNDVDVGAAGFIDRAHDVAADTAKSVDCNSDSHVNLLQRLGRVAAS
jgi:hypothetical protein